LAETIRKAEPHRLLLDGQEVEWRLVRSPRAKKLRIKVGPDGIVVVLPEGRDGRDATAFISNQRAWVAELLVRVRQLHVLRRPSARNSERILFRGDMVAVRVVVPRLGARRTKLLLSTTQSRSLANRGARQRLPAR
jgi:predicted metal-dependent hydrolase